MSLSVMHELSLQLCRGLEPTSCCCSLGFVQATRFRRAKADPGAQTLVSMGSTQGDRRMRQRCPASSARVQFSSGNGQAKGKLR